MSNDGLIAYLNEIRSHLNQYQHELDSLSQQVSLHPLSSIEYRALERLLQLSVEASIGLAKHWVKDLNEVSPNDAYQAFKMLKSFECIDSLDSFKCFDGFEGFEDYEGFEALQSFEAF